MRQAVMYTRVSSKDQEREGYSIPAQQVLLREYAVKHGFQIIREFVDVETAKVAGRKAFGEMVAFLKWHRNCRVVLAEKTDRLYRNFKDYVVLEDLDTEIHLPKEGHIIAKDSRSHDRLIHGIKVVLARNYIDNLREEVTKGLRQKAEQGVFPGGRPPLGYRNNIATHTIEIHPENVAIVRRMFAAYATGNYSLSEVRRILREEFSVRVPKSHLHRLLQNRFYLGEFLWRGKQYNGSHPPIISRELFDSVQQVFNRANRPRRQKHEFAFAGLLQCAHDGCAITAEIKKQRYVYYHCTGFRGKCDLPYLREEELADRLGQVLANIHIPDAVLAQLKHSLATDHQRNQQAVREQRQRLQQRLSTIRQRLDQAYLDKLDGKIDVAFWERKSTEWRAEEQQVATALAGLDQPNQDRLLDASRILELANKAHFLYVSQNPIEKAKLLKMVLSNCVIDRATLYPTYRKPFDLIFQRAKTKEWRGRRDSNLRRFGGVSESPPATSASPPAEILSPSEGSH